MKVILLPPRIVTFDGVPSNNTNHAATITQYNPDGSVDSNPVNIMGLIIPNQQTMVVDFAESVRELVGMGQPVNRSYSTLNTRNLGRSFWSFSELVDYANENFEGVLYLESNPNERGSWIWFTSHPDDYHKFNIRLGEPKGPNLTIRASDYNDARLWAYEHNMIADFRDGNGTGMVVYLKDDKDFVHFKLRWG